MIRACTGGAVCLFGLLGGISAPASAAVAAPSTHKDEARGSAPTRSPAGVRSADRSALVAYHGYLTALDAGLTAASARDDRVVSAVSSSCPGALADLRRLSPAQLRGSALTAFGDEVDADLSLAYAAEGAPALATLASGLRGLSWSVSGPASTTTELIRAEQALLSTTPGALCADATALDAAPLSQPASTVAALTRYRRATARVHRALTGFQALLARYETAAEADVVSEINGLVTEYSQAASSAEATAAHAMLFDLGLMRGSTSG